MVAKAARVDSSALMAPLEELRALLEAFPAPTDSPSDLQHVTDLVRDLMDVDVASVLDTSNEPARVVASSPPELADLARTVGGIPWPAVAVSRSGSEVHFADLAMGSAGGAAEHELVLRSVAALPLISRERVLGTLSLYDRTVHDWTEGELALARLAAGMIAVHLDDAAAVRNQKVLAGQLQTALDSRVIIEQAKGVLAASASISVDEAFARMREQARCANAKLGDVASAVVAGDALPLT